MLNDQDWIAEANLVKAGTTLLVPSMTSRQMRMAIGRRSTPSAMGPGQLAKVNRYPTLKR